MSNRRRQKGEVYHHQEVQGTRSHYRKPSHSNWQPTVPTWEKRFCYLVGSVPWRKLLETKKFMYLYENVVQWNDSAGEEAFHNAKSRFWAEINGLPCNISLPDPDIYIDKIDWNSNIDPELLLDLEREPKAPDEKEKGEEVVILGNSSLLLNQLFSCTGWGDAEEGQQKAPNSALDHGLGNHDQNVSNDKHLLENDNAQTDRGMKNNGCGDCWNDLYGWGNNWNALDNNYNESKNIDDRNGGHWANWDGNCQKREGAGWHMSRYKTSRFHGDDYRMDRGWWRNGRGRKRVNFAC